MNIPEVFVEINRNDFMTETSIHIEIREPVSDYLASYIKALVRTCNGFMVNHNIKYQIEQIINYHLYQLANEERIFKDIDGIWDVEGFLWVNNDY